MRTGRKTSAERWDCSSNGEGIRDLDPRGERHTGASFVLFNAHPEWMEFVVPSADYGKQWEAVIDTSQPVADKPKMAEAGEACGCLIGASSSWSDRSDTR